MYSFSVKQADYMLQARARLLHHGDRFFTAGVDAPRGRNRADETSAACASVFGNKTLNDEF